MFSLLLIFMVLLCCSAFFSGSETALFSLSGVQLHRFREAKGGSSAKLVENLKQPRKMLVTILLGNELVNVCISIVGAAIISRLLPVSVEAQTLAAVIIITPIILTFGEILPKNAALRFAPQIAPVIIWPLHLFHKLVKPLRVVLTFIADKVILIFGGHPEKSEPMIMEEEFRRLVDMGRKEGVIIEEERRLIHNVFEFSDKVVRDIMTPSGEIFELPVDMPYDDIVREIRNVQYSRVPVYEGSRDNIVGVLLVKDLFKFHRKKLYGDEIEIRNILHDALFVEGSMPLEHLLKEFQRSQMHMAVVRDGLNRVTGIVTMDDVLEELFGEMES